MDDVEHEGACYPAAHSFFFVANPVMVKAKGIFKFLESSFNAPALHINILTTSLQVSFKSLPIKIRVLFESSSGHLLKTTKGLIGGDEFLRRV